MKIILISLIIAFSIPNCLAQSAELSNQGSLLPLMPHGYGGFGGPQFKITPINGRGSMIGGGPIALVIRPGFKWLASFNYMEGGPDSISLWYAGLGAEYSILSRAAIEVNVSSQLGIGRAMQKLPNETVATTLFTLEPEISTGIKITQFDKLKIGLGYRAVLPAETVADLTSKKLSGFYGVVYLAYGIFDVNQRKEHLSKNKAKTYLSGTYSMKFTRLNGQSAILDGGGTRLFIHRKFAIGVSGYRTLKTVDYQGNEFSIVYGGLWLYYPMGMLNKVHLSLSCLVGYGGVGYVRKDDQELVGKGMPVIDPDLFVNLNLTEFMQLGIGVGYRLAMTHFEAVNMSAISGFTTSLQVRFAAF